MTLPVVSVPKKKNQKPSLVLTLSAAGLLIGGGSAAYWLLGLGHPFSRDLLMGANIIPQDALLAVSLSTDPREWQKLRNFGNKETQAELEKSLVQLRDRFLTNHGYDFQKDIQPWVGDKVTIAVLTPQNSQTKPVATVDPNGNQQSMVMVLPVENLKIAKNLLAAPKNLKQGQWIDRTYEGFPIKQTNDATGANLSVTLLDNRFLVITDNLKATERAIEAYKNEASLSKTAGFAENFPKIATYQPFAQFYLNVPKAAKIAAATPHRPLPAQVLAQLQNNQGLAGTVTLEPEGIRLKGISWLHPNSQRVLRVENKAGNMQNLVPAETLMMLSGGNLYQSWEDYISTSQGNPLSPITPEQLRNGVKSLTNLDLERDLLSWMKGEFSISVIPNTPTVDSSDDFRAGFLFMVKASDRQAAEKSLKQLDDIMKNQFQFQVQQGTVAGKPVVNWIGPFGTQTATHGWIDGNVAFLVIGAPITDKIVPQPNYPLASTLPFQQTVPPEPNPTNGQFFLDVERTAKNFPLPTLLPNQQTWLAITRSIGVTTAVNDSRSNRYDVFLALKKAENSANSENSRSTVTVPLSTKPSATKSP